jgi:selT/selW/selH-like putative selenoprotein
LAAKIQRAIGVQAQMIQSSGGVFEVVADGELLYSKKATGVFPEEDEIVRLLKARAS